MSRRVVVATAALVVVALAVALVAALATGGSTPTPTATASAGAFSGHGVTFAYPPMWTAGSTRFLAETTTAGWSESFVPFDGPQGVSVSGYTLQQDLSTVPPAQLEAGFASLIQGLARKQGGGLTRAPSPVTIAGLAGYRATFTARVNGRRLTNEITILFVDDRQWNIQCQYAPKDRATVTQGCRQVLESFSLG